MPTIRCSMLPGYADCARRAAARQYRSLIESRGYTLRRLPPSIGAAVGTATHTAVEHLLRLRMEGKDVRGVLAAAVEVGAEKLAVEAAEGVEWDDTTPRMDAAKAQVSALTTAYLPIAQEANPVLLEASQRATIAPGWTLTGTLDLLDADGVIDDLKTGSVARPYQAQIGAYSLLSRSNGRGVTGLRTTFIKRVRQGKPQPAPVRDEYDRGLCEDAAWAGIERIRRDVEAFQRTGNPWAFEPNPMSLMCSKRYCPAWGTEFCEMHLPEKGDG